MYVSKKVSVWNEVSVLLNTYDPEGFYDELFLDDGQPRPHASPLIKWLQNLPPGLFRKRTETTHQSPQSFSLRYLQ